MRELNLTCPLFWRMALPGIPNCTSFKRPVNNVTEMEEHMRSNPMYNWEKIKGQNEIGLQLLDESSSSGTLSLSYEIIDGYEIGLQRPDLHVSEGDCLHNAHPAVADASNIVILHYLRESRTEEDILRTKSFKYGFDRVTNVRLDGGDIDWKVVNGL